LVGKRNRVPLSYIDDVNSVRVGKVGPMDEVLEETPSKYRMKWDRTKDWKNVVHLRVNLDGRKHWKFRTGRAEAEFNLIRKLSRLPPEAKRKIVIRQLLPILTYGSELHNTPPEESSRLAAKWARWVAMGYQGSSRKISDITGMNQFEELTYRKRVRWAAGVYARNEPELRQRAERILMGELGEDVILNWMEGTKTRGGDTVRAREGIREGERTAYTAGSRMEGVAAGATAEGGIFLESYATVMDAEMIGIAGAWEEGYTTVTSDSQAAIRRYLNLTTGVHGGRSWIDEEIIQAMEGAGRA